MTKRNADWPPNQVIAPLTSEQTELTKTWAASRDLPFTTACWGPLPRPTLLQRIRDLFHLHP
jgi:hypothetical protein